ncbi:MAG: ankyrin repeat domain-containing protein [Syntrophaceae bacterium]
MFYSRLFYRLFFVSAAFTVLCSCTPSLINAAKEGNISALKIRIKEGINPNSRPAHIALIKAVQENQGEAISILLAAGVSPDISTDYNMYDLNGPNPVLIDAARYGCENALENLLKGGANIEIRGIHNQTALMQAVMSGHVNCAKILLRFGANPNAEIIMVNSINGVVLNKRKRTVRDFDHSTEMDIVLEAAGAKRGGEW